LQRDRYGYKCGEVYSIGGFKEEKILTYPKS
jgi:hypothetical protein